MKGKKGRTGREGGREGIKDEGTEEERMLVLHKSSCNVNMNKDNGHSAGDFIICIIARQSLSFMFYHHTCQGKTLLLNRTLVQLFSQNML